MKERIQEALRRRHRKGDEGFTLIELLVVILIIAILAAVGIVALLAALNSGRKSSATTVASSAALSVKAWQTSQTQTDYAGISDAVMDTADPDLDWVAGPVTAGNNVSINLAGGIVTLATISDRGARSVCYYVILNPNPPAGEAGTRYASSAEGAACNAAAPAIAVGPSNVRRVGFAN